MQHHKSLRKLGRSPSHRKALFRNLATSFLQHEKLETTVQKAKELRRVVERLITLGGKDDLHSRRQAYSYIFDKGVVHKLFTEVGPRFKERPGGYTRITRTRRRQGDAAEMAIIEMVTEELKPKAKKKAAKKVDKVKAEVVAEVEAAPVEEDQVEPAIEQAEGEVTEVSAEEKKAEE